jgi:hypothetical protein
VITFALLAASVQVGLLIKSVGSINSVTEDYYRLGSLTTVETEISLINSGVSLQYLNFTSNLDNVFVSYENMSYVIDTGAGKYVVFPGT